eukprot:CAMPEP_0171057076 /NCGR_PEP_ID=MMETSP0766_2-20121228/1555_1 /TAXON_ID=439317 /ORGANISM="Gambierdiscus australes, Strain CAWD 149" /LENGTH=282 /DNA_ID=CAMNT_0011512127 /DNA_START=80 /DNA_END=928 /DNA_ORIENTATION=-
MTELALRSEMQPETLNLKDGSTVEVMRNQEMTDSQWIEAKRYMESNPEETRDLEEYSTNPDKMRKQMLMKTITEVWQKMMSDGDDEFSRKIKALEEDPEFEKLFSDIKAYDVDQIRQYYEDDVMMMKVSKKMGGIPRECKPTLEKIRKTPITLQEACKFGDIKQLQKYLKETDSDPSAREIDAMDQRGVTCLGYAIGANRMAVAKLLIENKADPNRLDLAGNNGCHYAGGYGRKDLLEYLIGLGVSVNAANKQGLTPLDAATKNKREGTMEILAKQGATASA